MKAEHRWGFRPTREGVAYLVFTVALGAVAGQSGNNLLVLLVAVLLAVGVVTVTVGPLNLLRIEVSRALPYEWFARVAGSGAFVVRNRGKRSVRAVRVSEAGAQGLAAFIAEVDGGEERRIRARWLFRTRGVARLDRVRVASSFPFGLLEWHVDISVPVEVLVFPRPRPGGVSAHQYPVPGSGERVRVGPRGTGELDQVRLWRPGDSRRDVHWNTTARRGAWMVAVRGCHESAPIVSVVVDPDSGDLEVDVSRACGELLDGFARGCRVGLTVGPRSLEPRTGWSWRSRLLAELALVPPTVTQ